MDKISQYEQDIAITVDNLSEIYAISLMLWIYDNRHL